MSKKDESGLTTRQAAVAILTGIAGAVLIWIITPYNDLVFNSPYVSDSYLPVAGSFYVLLVVLGLNPLLRRCGREGLGKRQLALMFAVILLASVVPGQGLMRILPHAIAKVPHEVRENKPLADAYADMALPGALLPDRLAYGAAARASEWFLRELPEGETIPWTAWAGPLVSWGAFLLFSWLMVLGMSLIVFPQWREAERLAFPLLVVHQSWVEAAPPGAAVGGVFRQRGFWIAAGAVFFLHFLSGAQAYFPSAVPAIPLKFSLQALFTEEPFRHLPWWISSNRIYFTFVGVAFFMPGRTAFSVWFFVIGYAICEMVGRAYMPPYQAGAVTDHRVGGMAVVAAVVLWLGRARWRRAFGCMFRPALSEEDGRDRVGAFLFVGGMAGMVAWMAWIGVDWYWALFLAAFAFASCLLIARIVAETGMPFVRIDTGSSMTLLKDLPATWYAPNTLWFSQMTMALFTFASRVSLATMATHAMGMDERASPRSQTRIAWISLGVLCLGVLVAGAVTLHACYHHTSSLDGVRTPLSPGGTAILDSVGSDIVRRRLAMEAGRNGPLEVVPYSRAGHTVFGAGLAAVLSWACLAMPRWPLHPIGLLIVGSVYAQLAWFSVFLGWAATRLIVRFGGAGLFRRARPVFLGLIAGEVFAAVLWFLVPAVIILCGGTSYVQVNVVPQ